MQGFDAYQALIETLYPYLSAAGLTMARGLGLVLVFPVFTRLGLTGLLRAGVVLSLSLPLLPAVVGQVEAAEALGPGRIAALVVKEALLGVVLGLAFGLPFWSVEAAGEVLDFYRGASMAYLIDPGGTDQASLFGTTFSLVMMVIFFLIGGFYVVIDGLYESYSFWPVLDLAPSVGAASFSFFLDLLGNILQLGLVFAGPPLIAMFLGELALALVNRFAPNLNVFDLSLSVKNLILLLILPVYAVFLVDYFKRDLADLDGVIDNLKQFIE